MSKTGGAGSISVYEKPYDTAIVKYQTLIHTEYPETIYTLLSQNDE